MEALDVMLTDLYNAMQTPISHDEAVPERERELERTRQIRAVIHKHLGDAWDDGDGRSIDIRTALDIARKQIELLKKSNRDLLKRVSDGR